MDNINDIIASLSSEDIEMLKGVASSILGDDESTEHKQKENKPSPIANTSAPVQTLAGLGLDGIDFEMIMKAKDIFEKMNNTHNKNADLIMALKPHLSKETQSKADNALRILRLFDVLPLLKELF